MAVKLRLMRFGKKKQPSYRIVAIKSTAPVKSAYLENIGTYNPFADNKQKIQINKERLKYWQEKGAVFSKGLLKLLQ